MQRTAKAVVVGVGSTDDVSPYIDLLVAVVRMAVKDARQYKNAPLRHEARRFLWDVVPAIATHVEREE